ncbi:MAG: carbamate kinase, partial [Aquificota bacterium]
GVDAVIDKDRAGAKLAQEVEADTLLILTDVEHAFLNFGTPKEEPLGSLGVEEAKQYLKEGHFKAGSMGPKVEASIGFVEAGGESAIITSLDKASEALEGKTGTHIHR